MSKPIRFEEIYDAALDDEAFSALAGALAADLGARSGVIYWRSRGGLEEVADTNYFTREHMSLYDNEFSKDDLWSKAVGNRSGRAWRCDELVSKETYENSRIYNDWTCHIGDDSFYCIGAAIHSDGLVAKVGFHRGKSQGGFDDDAVIRLNEHLQHLGRMVQVRSKLARAEASRIGSLRALDALALGIFRVSPDGGIISYNAAAEGILRRGDCVIIKNGRLTPIEVDAATALSSALDRAWSSSRSQGSAFSLARLNGEPYSVSVIAASVGNETRQILVLINDPQAEDAGLQARLRSSFSLTETEAQIAVLLSQRKTLAEIAAIRGSGFSTIRAQVKALTGKLDCSRQSEVVAIVKSFPSLAPLN